MPKKLKHCWHETLVKPALLYGEETWALWVKKADQLRKTEAKMRSSDSMENPPKTTSETFIFLETANLVQIKELLRPQRLKWYEHKVRHDKGQPTAIVFA